jgi:catechol 2,3-dioxygenase-like lactoylglutathione lyase family enzyme
VHDAFNVPADRWPDALERLAAHGVAVHGPTRLEWMAATGHSFYDPDGNLLEFWTPDGG